VTVLSGQDLASQSPQIGASFRSELAEDAVYRARIVSIPSNRGVLPEESTLARARTPEDLVSIPSNRGVLPELEPGTIKGNR